MPGFNNNLFQGQQGGGAQVGGRWPGGGGPAGGGGGQRPMGMPQGMPGGGGGGPGPQGPPQGPPQQPPGGPPPGQSFNFLGGQGGQMQQRGEQQRGYQSQIDDLMQQLQFAQIQGGNPMEMAGLQQQLGQAQRGFGDWQQQQFAQGMQGLSQPVGGGAIGGGGAPSRAQMDPYLAQLLMSQLGMGGGRGGGGFGPQMG